MSASLNVTMFRNDYGMEGTYAEKVKSAVEDYRNTRRRLHA